MKPMSIRLNDIDESKIIASAVLRATGVKNNTKPAKFFFIDINGKIVFSNEEKSYQRRIEDEISVYDALIYLDGLIEKEPFLNRSGQRVKLTWSIDGHVRDQFVSMCNSEGLKVDKALENLIAKEIKRKILGGPTE